MFLWYKLFLLIFTLSVNFKTTVVINCCVCSCYDVGYCSVSGSNDAVLVYVTAVLYSCMTCDLIS